MIAQVVCVDIAAVTVHCHSLLPEQWSEGSRGSNCVIVPNFVAIGQAVAEIWRFFLFFQDVGRPPSWIYCVRILTTHKEHLVISIIVQNLVEIDAVVLIIYMFLFLEFGLKMPIHAPPHFLWGGFDPVNGESYQRNPKSTSLRESASFEPFAKIC